MNTAAIVSTTQREPELLGQTVVVIGGSAGIGLETARRARSEGANVILAARNQERLKQAASKVERRVQRPSMPPIQLQSSAFSATWRRLITSW
jgi:short-subunit dehydrogenase